jgi:hypothetical protein
MSPEPDGDWPTEQLASRCAVQDPGAAGAGFSQQLQEWIKETLIPDSRIWAEQLRRLPANPGKNGRKIWDEAVFWLMDMRVDW